MFKKTLILLGLIFFGLSLGMISGCGSSSSPTPGPATMSKLYLAGKSNEIIVFDPAIPSVEASIYITGATSIKGVAVSTDKIMLYAVDSSPSNKKIYSYNLSSSQQDEIDVSSCDSLGGYLTVSPNGSRVFAPTGTNAGVFAFSTSSFALEKFATMEGLGGDWGRGVAANDSYAYIANYAGAGTKGSILKYDIDIKTIVASVEVPANGAPWFIRFNSSGNKIYVPTFNANKVFVLDLTIFSFEASSINIGGTSTDIAVTTGGKAYVTNYSQDNVSVISNIENKIVTGTITLDAGSGPESVVLDEARNRAYVNCFDQAKLYVIDTVNDSIETTVSLPSSADQAAPVF